MTNPAQSPAPMTTEQARGYQALRGHLATLKLSAAAEALPAELDAARDEGLSMTAALERLLAIEGFGHVRLLRRRVWCGLSRLVGSACGSVCRRRGRARSGAGR